MKYSTLNENILVSEALSSFSAMSDTLPKMTLNGSYLDSQSVSLVWCLVWGFWLWVLLFCFVSFFKSQLSHFFGKPHSSSINLTSCTNAAREIVQNFSSTNKQNIKQENVVLTIYISGEIHCECQTTIPKAVW